MRNWHTRLYRSTQKRVLSDGLQHLRACRHWAMAQAMSTYERATELMEAEVGDELVALQPSLGLCFGFNSVAAAVWQRLDTPKSAEELVAELLDEYEVERSQCAAELDELLDRMTEHGLIRRRSE